MRNFSGSPATSASRWSRGKPKPSSVSSRDSAANTICPTRNLARSRTTASYARGSVKANARTSSPVTMPVIQPQEPATRVLRAAGFRGVSRPAGLTAVHAVDQPVHDPLRHHVGEVVVVGAGVVLLLRESVHFVLLLDLDVVRDVVGQRDLQLRDSLEPLGTPAELVREHDVRAVVGTVGVLPVPAARERVDPLDLAVLRADRVLVRDAVLEPAARPARAGVGRPVGRNLRVAVEHAQELRHRHDLAGGAAAEGDLHLLRAQDLAVVARQLVVLVLPGERAARGAARRRGGRPGVLARLRRARRETAEVLRLRREPGDDGGDPLEDRGAPVLQRAEDGVLDEVRAALALRLRNALVGLVGLRVELVEVVADLGHGRVGDVGELAGDVRARDLDGLGLLVGLRPFVVRRLGGLVLLFLAGVDAHDGPEVGGLVAVAARGAGLDEALVVRVGVRREVADVVVQVLRAVADAGLRDEVVGVEVAVLVAAAVDGERAGRRAVDRARVELVRLDLEDVDEERGVGLVGARLTGVAGGRRDDDTADREREGDAAGRDLRSAGNAMAPLGAGHGWILRGVGLAGMRDTGGTSPGSCAPD